MHRFPEDIPVTLADFRRSGWEEIFESGKARGYSGIWHALSDAASLAADAGDFPKAKALWLLADACSMTLATESRQEPYRPILILEDRRSALPDDLDEEALHFFDEVLSETNDAWLRARLSDLLWIKKKPREPSTALAAIDAYKAIPLEIDTWRKGGRECWHRAIQLSKSLAGGAGDRLERLEEQLLKTFLAAPADGDAFAYELACAMREQGLARDAAHEVASRLSSIAKSLRDTGDLHQSRDHFDEASRWFGLAEDPENSAEAAVAVAESWVAEAEAQLASENPSHMAAAGLLETAVQAYRSVPRTFRPKHGVDAKLSELRRRVSQEGELSLADLGRIESPPIDISDTVKNARDSVRGKDLMEALLALANVSGVSEQGTRDLAEETIRDHPLLGLLSATHVSREGRVVAKSPGFGSGDEGTEEFESAVWAQMMRNYSTIEVPFAVQSRIWPALQAFLLEHRVRERDLVRLARYSPIVPPGREVTFGKALFAGFDYDFSTALHLMAPQIEHLVRWHLKANGVSTTTLNSDGIENEIGLSALMENPAADAVFAADLAFEIRALFCDPRGPNLRNEVAHGLLADDASNSLAACYAWWFALKLVFNTFWNAHSDQDGPATGEEE